MTTTGVVRRWRSEALAASLGLVALSVAGCGYSLAGRGNFLPEYIKVIGVPQFVNHSTMADIDRVITENVRAEFSSHSRYLVQPDDTGADAVLRGTITTVRLDASAFSATRQASSVTVIVTASVEFTDTHAQKVLWSNPAVQFREDYPVTTSLTPNDPAAFFGHDAAALERLAKSFARSIVTSILEAF
jgi:hypothetical protein